jgi:endo-1,4-beta-mannosidase
MAAEEDLASHLEAVLPRLVRVGAIGAGLWCYADYARELYDRPPCREEHHERFFGFVRPDGSLKPHAAVVRKFADSSPQVLALDKPAVTLDITPDEFYADPRRHAERLYRNFRL